MTKIFVITVKGLEPVIFCGRVQDATIVSTRHMWDEGSLNWLQFMLQWFIRFPEFAEFTEFLFHLGKTPMFVCPVSSQWNLWIFLCRNLGFVICTHRRKCIDSSSARIKISGYFTFCGTHCRIMLFLFISLTRCGTHVRKEIMLMIVLISSHP